MIVAREEVTGINTEHIAATLKQQTIMPFEPWSPQRRYNWRHKLTSTNNFYLMTGGSVPAHSDDIQGYRPLLVLENPGYVIKGDGQYQAPQPPGTLLMLDIEAKHMAVNAGECDHGWLLLGWYPDGLPLMKSDWPWVDAAMITAREKLQGFLRERVKA